MRYFGLDDTARLVVRDDNKMPTEVVGERQHRLNNVLFWIIPFMVVFVILVFAFLR
jgi:hypothetical protein